jgi:hypothetical protein
MGRYRARANRPTNAVFLWCTLPTIIAGLGMPHVARADNAPGRSPVLRAVRRVHVHRVWCAPGMETNPKIGLSLLAHVEASGLRWQTLRVEVRLRTPNGKPVRVADGAPEGYADKKGRFFMSTSLPIFDDPFEWKELRASVPYEKVLEPSSDGPRQLIAAFRVSAGGLSSVSEAEITVPPVPAPGVKREVRLLAVDLFAGATSRKAGNDRGLIVEGYVGAVGLDRAKMLGRFSIRREDGRPLMSNDPNTPTKKPFRSTVESDVVADQAQVFEHFVGYRALGLAPGRHRLVFTYSAQSQGLLATTEEEHLIEIPARQDDDSYGP